MYREGRGLNPPERSYLETTSYAKVHPNDKAVGLTELGKTQIDIGGLCAVLTFFKAQGSLYVPPSPTFNHSTFCPRSVFMCFVWI
jgi:hypothetical protein